MLFGNSILYPEMSVHDNLVFALRMAKLSQTEIAARVKETAELLELEPILGKMPDMLSGPEIFRALLGRAVICFSAGCHGFLQRAGAAFLCGQGARAAA